MDIYSKEISNYRPVIEECFATDKELLDRWHICAPADLSSCVSRTIADLEEAETLKMFVIKCASEDGDEIVGFFGHETAMGLNWMTSFFIKPKYRTRKTLKQFWSLVYEQTGNQFFTAIYSTNARAKKFLEKNGFELVQITELENNKNALIYSNN